MGMFDVEPNLTSEMELGKPFELLDGEYKGIKNHPEFGNNSTGRVKIGNKWYAVYGVLADQISRMEPGELPATVTIERVGRAHTFVKSEQDAIPF